MFMCVNLKNKGQDEHEMGYEANCIGGWAGENGTCDNMAVMIQYTEIC